MDCSYKTFGCYLEPVPSYLEDVVLKKDRLSLDISSIITEEASEFKTVAQNWESLGAIPEALENYSEFVKRLLFIRDKTDLTSRSKESIQNLIDKYVDYSIDLYLIQ